MTGPLVFLCTLAVIAVLFVVLLLIGFALASGNKGLIGLVLVVFFPLSLLMLLASLSDIEMGGTQ